ncbi:MAG: C4-dicarboxylate transporter DctQ subunit [Paracoccaceae bacterium]|jgi:C4-dicarboxylate transporter DctQ subunit
MSGPSQTPLGRMTDALEESLIAIILGAMTLITFANVVARYGFNSNILWALEATSFLFAWLVLLGASYCVKKNLHLGVDAVVNMFKPGPKRMLALVSSVLCVIYALLLLKGGWDYWAPFAELSPTSGRIIPTGFETVRGQGWYEVNDIEMPAFLNPLFSNLFNQGEAYEKMPRLIPYAVLPLSMALLLFRFVQITLRIWRGEIDVMIASHEVEDQIEDAAKTAQAKD